MRLHYQSRIPILNSGRIPRNGPLGRAIAGEVTKEDFRKFVRTWDKRTRDISLFKPANRLGGSWLDDFIAQRKAVALCPNCERKYGDWQVRFNYGKRDHKEITDCDGCGETPILCSSFYSKIVN